MSSLRAVYACTRLQGTEKRGVLVPDADVYYEMIVGALDVYNSAGAFYDFQSAKAVFDASGSLQRRIAAGQLRGEYGHPKRLPGQDMQSYINRIMTIDESQICVHFKEIRLETGLVKSDTGRPVLAIVAKIKPCGPRGPALKEQLENGSENVSFSIRSLTDDQVVGGVLHKHIRTVICWDYVNEPGIACAEKYKSPSLESLEEVIVTRDNVIDMQSYRKMNGISLESGTVSVEEIMRDLGWTGVSSPLPGSARW
jgi:hypothetical protein